MQKTGTTVRRRRPRGGPARHPVRGMANVGYRASDGLRHRFVSGESKIRNQVRGQAYRRNA